MAIGGRVGAGQRAEAFRSPSATDDTSSEDAFRRVSLARSEVVRACINQPVCFRTPGSETLQRIILAP